MVFGFDTISTSSKSMLYFIESGDTVEIAFSADTVKDNSANRVNNICFFVILLPLSKKLYNKKQKKLNLKISYYSNSEVLKYLSALSGIMATINLSLCSANFDISTAA